MITNLLIGFLVGLGADQVISYLWYRHRDKVDPMHAPHLATRTKRNVALVMLVTGFLAVMVYITGATNQNTNCTKTIVRTFQTELNIAKQEREGFISIIQQAVNPPPDIAALDPQDPVRQEWGKKLTLEYLGNQQRLAGEREANRTIQEAAFHRCGG